VHDQGGGIDEPERSRIFEKYYRASGHRGTTGSGLGLHISREIARQHGGDVTLRSSGPQGSVFRLSLPIQTFETASAPA
jgi:two-component system, sensor histidine kinase LadS